MGYLPKQFKKKQRILSHYLLNTRQYPKSLNVVNLRVTLKRCRILKCFCF